MIRAFSWILRGKLVVVETWPKLAESIFVPGAAKWTEFVTLNTSAVTASFQRSLMPISRRRLMDSSRR